jgi:hypothetical protein
MRDDEFEWDDSKAVANLAEHGVSFVMARDVFDDPFSIVWVDDREDYGEDRLCLVGMSEKGLIFVGYTFRGSRIRIISARGAERYERRRYHEEER